MVSGESLGFVSEAKCDFTNKRAPASHAESIRIELAQTGLCLLRRASPSRTMSPAIECALIFIAATLCLRAPICQQRVTSDSHDHLSELQSGFEKAMGSHDLIKGKSFGDDGPLRAAPEPFTDELFKCFKFLVVCDRVR
jgi:hypothetical protein